MHDWGGWIPSDATGNGEMDSDCRQATSPRAFMVIDDKGGEEHGLKLQLGTGEMQKSRRKLQIRVSVSAGPV